MQEKEMKKIAQFLGIMLGAIIVMSFNDILLLAVYVFLAGLFYVLPDVKKEMVMTPENLLLHKKRQKEVELYKIEKEREKC